MSFGNKAQEVAHYRELILQIRKDHRNTSTELANAHGTTVVKGAATEDISLCEKLAKKALAAQSEALSKQADELQKVLDAYEKNTADTGRVDVPSHYAVGPMSKRSLGGNLVDAASEELENIAAKPLHLYLSGKESETLRYCIYLTEKIEEQQRMYDGNDDNYRGNVDVGTAGAPPWTGIGTNEQQQSTQKQILNDLQNYRASMNSLTMDTEIPQNLKNIWSQEDRNQWGVAAEEMFPYMTSKNKLNEAYDRYQLGDIQAGTAALEGLFHAGVDSIGGSILKGGVKGITKTGWRGLTRKMTAKEIAQKIRKDGENILRRIRKAFKKGDIPCDPERPGCLIPAR